MTPACARVLSPGPVPPSEVLQTQTQLCDGIEVYLAAGMREPPKELHIEVRGRRRRLESYWDGCAYVV